MPCNRLACRSVALETESAEDFGDPGKVGVHLARRETSLCPIRLPVTCIKNSNRRRMALKMKLPGSDLYAHSPFSRKQPAMPAVDSHQPFRRSKNRRSQSLACRHGTCDPLDSVLGKPAGGWPKSARIRIATPEPSGSAQVSLSSLGLQPPSHAKLPPGWRGRRKALAGSRLT